MGLNSAIKGKVETYAIGFFIRGIESGRYGKVPQNIWLALKGKKTIIGWALFALGGAITAYPDPSIIWLGQSLAIVGSYLGRFGLVAKGSDRTPPAPFPEEYRGLAQSALSACTYLCEILTGIGGLLMMSDSDWAGNVSGYVLIAGQALSTAMGYLATLIGPTPKQAATAEVVQAVAAVEAAKDDVAEKKADVALAVEIASDVAKQPPEPR